MSLLIQHEKDQKKRKLSASEYDVQENKTEEEEEWKHNKESKHEDEESDDKKLPSNKRFGFCLGEEHGVIYDEQIAKSPLVQQLVESNVTWCISACAIQHQDTSTSVWLTFLQQHVEVDDILALLQLIHEEKLNTLHTLNVNYTSLLKLINFFQLDVKYLAEVMAYLEHQTIFHTPISALTAYAETVRGECESGVIQSSIPAGCMYETRIPLESRLKFAYVHYNHEIMDAIYKPQPMSIKDVAQTLQVEECILAKLNAHIVLAGGSCVKLGCPWSTYHPRCDVDIFVLQHAQQESNVHQLLQLLRTTNRCIYRKGDAVFCALGVYGVRQVQVIVCHETTGHELVNSFDLAPVRAFYDGTALQATVAAQHDWITKTCSPRTFRVIDAHRLFGIWMKGFLLAQEAKNYLAKTNYGWPVKAEIAQEYEFAIPCLQPSLPSSVQNANLRKAFQLECISDQEETPACTKTFARNRYHSGGHNIYAGDLKDYGKQHCTVSTKQIQCKKNRYLVMHHITCDYAIALRNVSLHTGMHKSREENHCYIQPVRLPIDVSYCLRHTIPNDLVAQLQAKGVIRLDKHIHHPSDNESIYIRLHDTTEWYVNGFRKTKVVGQEENNNSIMIANNAHVIIRPAYLYFKDPDNVIKLRWESIFASWIE